MNLLVGHYNYWVVIVLMMVGFYTLISRGNLVKKLLGLSLFQTSVFIMYISLGKVSGATAPILLGGYGGGHGDGDAHAAEGAEHGVEAARQVASASAEAVGQAAEAVGQASGEVLYSNPLPHVLILTAIVVGIATTAVGLSLVVRIRESYGTIEEDEIHAMDASL